MNSSGTSTASKRPRLGTKNDIIADGFIHLSPRTHDTSLAGEHIPNIAYLAEDLQASVQAVWPRRHEFRYSKVQVLLISWEDDDLGVLKEVTELQNVFVDLYHYEVEVYQIPSIKPDKELKRRMLEFLENDGEQTLLILYYGGHAKKSPLSNEAPIWFANRNPKSPSLPSGGIQSLVEEADSDALLLYDCCNAAATTVKSESQQDQQSVTEVVAACGYEAISPEVGEHSFTNALMETLAAASKSATFSIGELHNRILNRLKCWVPSVVKDKNGKMKEDAKGGLEYERQPRRTPVYSILCESKPRRSILLAPLRRGGLSPFTPRGGNRTAQNGECSKARSTGKRKRQSSLESEQTKCSQVILSVQISGDELDIPAWKECIRLFPAEAQNIKIEGIYESFSTLLLLRMPVTIWNLLPKNPAYSFVGYVTSENQATAVLLDEQCQEIPNVSFFLSEDQATVELLDEREKITNPSTLFPEQLRTMTEVEEPVPKLPGWRKNAPATMSLLIRPIRDYLDDDERFSDPPLDDPAPSNQDSLASAGLQSRLDSELEQLEKDHGSEPDAGNTKKRRRRGRGRGILGSNLKSDTLMAGQS